MVIGETFYPLRGDYGNKDLEGAHMKAPRGSDLLLEPFASCTKGKNYFTPRNPK
jgi:hypothetical protein